MSRFIDLSHPVTDGAAYPGLPEPVVTVHTGREESAWRLGTGVSFHIGQITLVGNTGTYVDAPFHYHAGLPDIAELPLERLVDVPIEVVRAARDAENREVTPADLGDPDRLWGRAVLVRTGWSRHWGTPAYARDNPHLTADAVRLLIDANVALVGIDSSNIDSIDDPSRPAHHGLLAAGIPILEHLTGLDRVPETGARLVALPPPVVGMASFPVRAVAILPAAS